MDHASFWGSGHLHIRGKLWPNGAVCPQCVKHTAEILPLERQMVYRYGIMTRSWQEC